MKKSRHILNPESQLFLDAIVETATDRRKLISKGRVLWRAQLGSDERLESHFDEDTNDFDVFPIRAPYPPRRMKPLRDRAFEGRVNPKGIPCLYLSTDKRTAMAETRPWMGSYVSVAQFEILRKLTVVNCSKDRYMPSVFSELTSNPKPEKLEMYTWGLINRAFSKPVTRVEDSADYAPTQILAEAFRQAGYDGVAYGSRLGKGLTVALFDLQSAKLRNCFLNEVKSIEFNFSEEPEFYSV